MAYEMVIDCATSSKTNIHEYLIDKILLTEEGVI